MRVSCLAFLLAAGSALAQGPAGPKPAPVKLPASRVAPEVPLSPEERAQQMLNRFTFGARPGDLQQVEAMGAEKWLARQLAPETIPDDALARRLQAYPTLFMSPEQILTVYPDRRIVQQVADGKRPYPADATEAAVYEVQVYKLNEDGPRPTDTGKDQQKEADQATAARIAGELFALPKASRMAALIAMPVPDRLAFARNLRGSQRDTLLNDFTPAEREAFSVMGGGVRASGRAGDELSQAHVLRAVLSERQLQEVMTDFWSNHFNVFLPKESDQWYTTAFERDAIRPHALGHFRDLLLATAQSPAMMVYLDNWLSIGPDSPANGLDPARPNAKPGRKGLNENYGREVMELHTLGVNGGYTQSDVTQLSSILTGWSVDRPGQGGPFQFDSKKHEPGTKEWFGYTIDDDGAVVARAPGKPAPPVLHLAGDTPAGMRQGLMALSILAAAPQTAHFISFLLCQRFLADDPPASVVDRVAATYLQTDGDIRAMLRTLAASPEFNSHRYFRNKVKMPLEFVASAFRATATDPQNPGAMVQRLRDLGEPPYGKLEPTGYYVTADQWMNTAALVKRLNFADELTHNRFANQKFDASRVLALALMARPADLAGRPPQARKVSADGGETGPVLALHVLEGTLVGGDISPRTDQFIHSQMQAQPAGSPADLLNLMTALLLGSPEFQLR